MSGAEKARLAKLWRKTEAKRPAKPCVYNCSFFLLGLLRLGVVVSFSCHCRTRTRRRTRGGNLLSALAAARQRLCCARPWRGGEKFPRLALSTYLPGGGGFRKKFRGAPCQCGHESALLLHHALEVCF